MQLCESRTLKTFLESPGRMVNIVENMIMFSQIVTGLNHIHSKGKSLYKYKRFEDMFAHIIYFRAYTP